MALTLAQLTAPLTKDQWTALILASLQGLGIVNVTGLGGGSSQIGTGSLTLSGTPALAYKVQVKIVTAGEQGTAQFSYSLDNGATFSATTTIPAAPGSIALGSTGVTLTFNSGPANAGTSFAVGDVFSFALNPSPLPVTSWQSGGAFRTIAEIESQALADLSTLVAAVAASGLTTTSTGSWLDLLAQNFYQLTRNVATYAKGQVSLSAVAGAGPYTVPTGGMYFADAAGHRYSNVASFTLQGALVSPVNATFTAGAGTLASGTYFYRVTATNAQGETLGSAETSLTIVGPAGINVNWTAVSGATGYKVYGRAAGAELLIATIASGGTTTYLDGGSVTPSGALPSVNTSGTLAGIAVQAEMAGAAYNVAINAVNVIQAGTLPGVSVTNPDLGAGNGWLTNSGADTETDSTLATRCQARWPALSQSAGTNAVYTLWALSAEAAAGHGTTITRTLIQPDAAVAGQVDVYLATATGPATASAVSDVSAYITPRVALPSTAVIQAATGSAMTVAGTIYYFSAKTTLAAVTSAVQTALTNYIAGVSMGTDSTGSVKIYWSEIEAAAGAALGVRNVSMTLNGGTADVALTLGQVATLTLGSMTYTAVTS